MAQLNAIIDQLLTQASSMLNPAEFGVICEQLMPTVGVEQTSGKLAKYGTSHLRIENSLKSGRGKYRRVEAISRSTTSYQIEGHGLEDIVTKEDYKNVVKPYDAEEDTTIGLSSMLLLEKEKLWADTLTSTSVITQTSTLSGTAQFSDYLNSDPIAKFAAARSAIKSGCGLPPDTAVMSWEVFNQLRFHPQILDSLGYKYARPGGLLESELAVAMGVKRVLVAMSSYESANEGQTSSLASIWGKHLVMGVFPEKAQVRQTSVGYKVQYNGDTPRKVYKTPSTNPPNATLIIVEDEYDLLVSNANAAYLYKSVIA